MSFKLNSKKCPMCGKWSTLDLTEGEYRVYNKYLIRKAYRSVAIQDMLPDFSATMREWVMTGYCPECQEKLFGNVDKSKFVEGDEIYVYSEF